MATVRIFRLISLVLAMYTSYSQPKQLSRNTSFHIDATNHQISGNQLSSNETTSKFKEKLLRNNEWRHENRNSTSLSNGDIIQVLRQRNYDFIHFSNVSPIVLLGDTAYYPETILPEILPAGADRSSNMNIKNLWIDEAGKQQVWYYFDNETSTSQKLFEKAVKSWTDSTCIKFNKMPPGPCDVSRGHAAICAGNYSGCYSFVGKQYNTNHNHSQIMSLSGGCELAAVAHELGHAIGLEHTQARPDVHEFMYINYHNMEVKMAGSRDRNVYETWIQAARCSENQVLNIPLPYDYLSLMQYGASDFADEDGRIIYSVKDPHYQYMLNYHRPSGMLQTHYDKMMVNLAYKCTDLWRRQCHANGKPTPTCSNNGYLAKHCDCACAPGYSGQDCSLKNGTMYPLQDRAKTMIDLNEPLLLDLADKGMFLQDHNYAVKNFIYYQYITVIINTGDEGLRPTIQIPQTFHRVEMLRQHQNFSIQFIRDECKIFLELYWGDASMNRLRTECMSSVLNNELSESLLQLRSNSSKLDIIGKSIFGYAYRSPRLSMHALELRLDITFAPNPPYYLKHRKLPTTEPDTSGKLPIRHPAESELSRYIPEIVLGVIFLISMIGLMIGCIATKLAE